MNNHNDIDGEQPEFPVQPENRPEMQPDVPEIEGLAGEAGQPA